MTSAGDEHRGVRQGDPTDEDLEALMARWPMTLASGPAAILRREDGGRERRTSHLAMVPRNLRYAEVICARTRHRATLLALVLTLDDAHGFQSSSDYILHLVPGLSYLLLTAEAPGDGNGFLSCRCGWGHVIDGERLRSALREHPRGRPLRLNVADVSRDQTRP